MSNIAANKDGHFRISNPEESAQFGPVVFFGFGFINEKISYYTK